MGQRHQLFVIAKIAGRYRRLAALHHQWLYGKTAIKTRAHLVKLFGDPANRSLLERELGIAKTLAEDKWEKKNTQPHVELRFPFITTCLVVGTSLLPTEESWRCSNVNLLDWNTDLDEVDNNDGVTIIDITRPQSIRSCFVFLGDYERYIEHDHDDDGSEDPAPSDTPGLVPLGAGEYIKAYYDEEAFDDIPLIPVGALEQIYTNGRWRSRMEALGRADPDEPADVPTVTTGTLSLTNMSMEKVIEDGIQNGPDIAGFADADKRPVFRKGLKTYIYAHQEMVEKAPFGVSMLKLAVLDSQELDLRPWPSLSFHQIKELIKSGAGEKARLSLLDLSGNQTIAPEQIATAIKGIFVDRLFLWHNNEEPAALGPLLHSGNVKALFHPSLFKSPFSSYDSKARPVFGAKTFLTDVATELLPGSEPPIAHIRQLAWLALVTGSEIASTADFVQTMREVIDELPRRASIRLGPSLDLSAAIMPLQDVYFDSDRLLGSLKGIAQVFTRYDRLQEAPLQAMAMASCIAMANGGIGPLPETLYHIAKDAYHSSANAVPVTMEPLNEGEWTIMLIQHATVPDETRGVASTQTFYLGFVSVDGNGKRIVLDLEAVLSRVLARGCPAADIQAQIQDLKTTLAQIEPSPALVDCTEEQAEGFLNCFKLLAKLDEDYKWGISLY